MLEELLRALEAQDGFALIQDVEVVVIPEKVSFPAKLLMTRSWGNEFPCLNTLDPSSLVVLQCKYTHSPTTGFPETSKDQANKKWMGVNVVS